MGKKSLLARILPLILAIVLIADGGVSVNAETLQDIRNEKQEALNKKKEAEGKLSSVNKDIENISEEQEAVEAEIEELDAELVDLLLSVDLLESDIKDKEQEIETTKEELEEAKQRVSEQEASMARRIKFMYERGSSTYLELFLESKSMAEAVNKSDYSEKLYKYDRLMLERYRMARQDVENKEIRLEEELAELEEIKEEFDRRKLERKIQNDPDQLTSEEIQRLIYDQLSSGELSADEIVRESGLPYRAVIFELGKMELEGRVAKERQKYVLTIRF